ncbi:hypothetical protein [Chromohalobacter canadensis]|uniref:hypothetical protein n=1 Tax=Chromohalobacter canadensis TaxID=141389 RepID=UPI00240FD444|nr:hypothetical protein [Chromohalobacter canadensis]
MKKLAFAAILASLSTATYAQQFYIKADSLICTSEKSYDEQMQYLAQGVKKYVSGCGSTTKKYQLVMLDFNNYSASKARIVENGQVIWFDQASTTVK